MASQDHSAAVPPPHEGVADTHVAKEDVNSEGFLDEQLLYEVDAVLDPVMALEKFCRSTVPSQRLAYASSIGAAAAESPAHVVDGTLLPLLKELYQDSYADIRGVALAQTTAAAKVLAAAGSLYLSRLHSLWGTLEGLLLDADLENQELAAGAAADLANLLAANAAAPAAQRLCSALDRLTSVRPKLKDEGLIQAMRLVTLVLAKGPHTVLTWADTQHFAAPLILDQVLKGSEVVREACTAFLPELLTSLSHAERQELLPRCSELLVKDSFWNVRAAAASMLVAFLEELSDLDSKERLSIRKHLAHLLEDASPRVKVSALMTLGGALPHLPASEALSDHPPLLKAFASCADVTPALQTVAVHPELVPGAVHASASAAAIKREVEAGVGSTTAEKDRTGTVSLQKEDKDKALYGSSSYVGAVWLPRCCAHYLPQVVTHLGPDSWHQLHPAWQDLMVSCDPGVLHSLVAGFPVLAGVLGPQVVQEQLLPNVVALVDEQVDILAPALAEHAAALVQVLPRLQQVRLLELLPSLATPTGEGDAGDWRTRLHITQQLTDMAAQLTPHEVGYRIWPLLLMLCKDPVHAVRSAAAAQAGGVVAYVPAAAPAAADVGLLQPEVPAATAADADAAADGINLLQLDVPAAAAPSLLQAGDAGVTSSRCSSSGPAANYSAADSVHLDSAKDAAPAVGKQRSSSGVAPAPVDDDAAGDTCTGRDQSSGDGNTAAAAPASNSSSSTATHTDAVAAAVGRAAGRAGPAEPPAPAPAVAAVAAAVEVVAPPPPPAPAVAEVAAAVASGELQPTPSNSSTTGQAQAEPTRPVESTAGPTGAAAVTAAAVAAATATAATAAATAATAAGSSSSSSSWWMHPINSLLTTGWEMGNHLLEHAAHHYYHHHHTSSSIHHEQHPSQHTPARPSSLSRPDPDLLTHLPPPTVQLLLQQLLGLSSGSRPWQERQAFVLAAGSIFGAAVAGGLAAAVAGVTGPDATAAGGAAAAIAGVAGGPDAAAAGGGAAAAVAGATSRDATAAGGDAAVAVAGGAAAPAQGPAAAAAAAEGSGAPKQAGSAAEAAPAEPPATPAAAAEESGDKLEIPLGVAAAPVALLELLQRLLQLSNDPVPGVRVTLARVLVTLQHLLDHPAGTAVAGGSGVQAAAAVAAAAAAAAPGGRTHHHSIIISKPHFHHTKNTHSHDSTTAATPPHPLAAAAAGHPGSNTGPAGAARLQGQAAAAVAAAVKECLQHLQADACCTVAGLAGKAPADAVGAGQGKARFDLHAATLY